MSVILTCRDSRWSGKVIKISTRFSHFFANQLRLFKQIGPALPRLRGVGSGSLIFESRQPDQFRAVLT